MAETVGMVAFPSPWEAAPDQTGATDRGGYSEAENCRALVVLTG